ncbi:hypothetical protein Tco_1528360, partial [Tanacetum coccineum]
TVESRSEDLRVHVDDGCNVDVSDATLSIKSDKNDNMLPVCDSTAQLDGDDTVLEQLIVLELII